MQQAREILEGLEPEEKQLIKFILGRERVESRELHIQCGLHPDVVMSASDKRLKAGLLQTVLNERGLEWFLEISPPFKLALESLLYGQ